MPAHAAHHHQPAMLLAAVHVVLTGVSVFVVAKVLPGMKVKSLGSAVLFALVVSVLNVVAWWFLAPLSLPLKWITLGLGGFIVNGLVFLVAARLVGGIRISGCVVAALAAVGVTFVNELMGRFLGPWAP
jgi:putative membrane protein